MDYEIRLAVLSDARRLAEVKIACWETTYRGIYPDSKLDNYDIEKNSSGRHDGRLCFECRSCRKGQPLARQTEQGQISGQDQD